MDARSFRACEKQILDRIDKSCYNTFIKSFLKGKEPMRMLFVLCDDDMSRL